MKKNINEKSKFISSNTINCNKYKNINNNKNKVSKTKKNNNNIDTKSSFSKKNINTKIINNINNNRKVIAKIRFITIKVLVVIIGKKLLKMQLLKGLIFIKK